VNFWAGKARISKLFSSTKPLEKALVKEVSLTREIHGDPGGLGGLDYLWVALRTARLNYRLHASFEKNLEAILERKECVRGGNCAA
jgi:hypothetical protein